MIAFLPIARYRVDYQVASGRPFSSFERLLLKSVKTGYGTVSDLAQIFCVHQRLIVEGLVTLMQAGWVSLGSDEGHFVLSPSGKVASAGKSLPDTIAISDRHLTVVVEKVTGQVARNNEIDFYSRSNLRTLWSGGVELRKGDISNIVDPGWVAGLLSHQPTEWIRWIGPIAVLSDNAAFAVIDVDTNAGRLGGIPKSWESLLLGPCLEQVQRQERKLVESDQEPEDEELRQLVRRDVIVTTEDEYGKDDTGWAPAVLDSSDVLHDTSQHEAAITTLIENAESYVALALPSFSEAGIVHLLPKLENAVNRGLLVNLFFAQLPDKSDLQGRRALDLLKKLEYDSTHNSGAGRLAIASRESECSSSIALADTGEGPSAILGVYPWASIPSDQSLRYLSIRVSEPRAVARLCELLADFSAADERLRLDSGYVRLKKAAEELRQTAQSIVGRPVSPLQARILLDRDHQYAIQALCSAATQSLKVFTNDLPSLIRNGWLRLIVSAASRGVRSIRIAFSSPGYVPNDNADVNEAAKLGVMFNNNPTIEGSLVIADNDSALVTSGRPDEISARQSYAARVGLALRGEGVSGLLGPTET
jgi:hypothetical protein